MECFEVVLGRQDGSIWHGCFNGTQYGLEEIDPLQMMIPGEALGFKPVIDLKIIQREFTPRVKTTAQRANKPPRTANPTATKQTLTTVYAVTHSNLYQFSGTDVLKSNF